MPQVRRHYGRGGAAGMTTLQASRHCGTAGAAALRHCGRSGTAGVARAPVWWHYERGGAAGMTTPRHDDLPASRRFRHGSVAGTAA